MKNKNIVIAAVAVVLLLLLGLGGYLMLNKNASNSPKTTANETSKTTNTNQATKSLLDLIQMGQNVRCTFKTALENGSTEGTIYVSGKNVRGDFNVISDGQKMQTSMINKGDTAYVWGSAMENKGIKMTIALDKMAENKQASQYVDPNQKFDYNCSPWSVDSSLFTPPSNIEFTDMSQFMMPEDSTTGTQTQPATNNNLCDAVSDPEAKAACESALNQSGN